MLTAKGQKLKSGLSQGLNSNVLADIVRPIVEKYSEIVVERIREKGIKGGASSYKSSWAVVRTKNSKQTGFKDFTFGGDMLNSVGIKDEDASPAGVKFVVKPSDGKQYDKAEGHSNYERKNIIEMTEDEVKRYTKDVIEAVKEYLTNVFR